MTSVYELAYASKLVKPNTPGPVCSACGTAAGLVEGVNRCKECGAAGPPQRA